MISLLKIIRWVLEIEINLNNKKQIPNLFLTIQSWWDDARYEGEIEDNLQHRTGKQVRKDGSINEGERKDELMHDEGWSRI